MKTVADALKDVSHAVLPSQLVLNLLRGFNPRFSSTADNIADTTPLHDFNTTRQKLVLKELRLANEGKALHASGSSSCGSTCRSASACFGVAQGQGNHGGGGSASNRNSKGRRSSGSSGGGRQQQQGGRQQQQQQKGGPRAPP
jgi:hypothetical protein